MIASVFFLSTLTAIVGYLLVSGRLARKERFAAVRRISGREPVTARPQRPPTTPVLLEMAHQVRGVLATRLLEHLRIRRALERRLETAGLKWGATGLAHRS